jgi:hypothetical protein
MEQYSTSGTSLEKILSLLQINPGDKLYEIINPGWRMNRGKKPKTGIKIYRFGILYKTIIDWIWNDPQSEICHRGIVKPGWSATIYLNTNHPITLSRLKKIKGEQQKMLKMKKVDWESLRNTVIDL